MSDAQWFLDQLEPKLMLWLTSLDYRALMSTDRSMAEIERAHLSGLEAQIVDVARRIGNITRMVEEGDGTKALMVRLRELESEGELLERQVKAQRDKVLMTETKEGSGKSRMEALIRTFREMRRLAAAGDRLKLRALREQLSAAIAQTVDRVILFPVGPSLKGDRTQRYMVVKLKNGMRYELDDADEIHYMEEVGGTSEVS
jgi:hypothetical protein